VLIHKLFNGVFEGFNTKAKLIIRNAYGFRAFSAAEMLSNIH